QPGAAGGDDTGRRPGRQRCDRAGARAGLAMVCRFSPTHEHAVGVKKSSMSDTNEPQAPKIEFPCPYPIKVVGDAAPDFAVFVADVLVKHTGESFHDRIEIIESRTGRFLSARVTITATGPEQLQALFEDLKASGRVHAVI